MEPKEDPGEKRKPQDMHAVEPEKCLSGHFGAAPEKTRKSRTDERC
jgi:hypothetical protein